MWTPPNTLRLTSGIQQSAYAGVSKYYYYNQLKTNIGLTHINTNLGKLLKAPMRRAGQEMRFFKWAYKYYPTQINMDLLPLNVYFKMAPHTKKVYVNTRYFISKTVDNLSYYKVYPGLRYNRHDQLKTKKNMCKLINKNIKSNIFRIHAMGKKGLKVNPLKVNLLSLSVLKQCFEPVYASNIKRELNYVHVYHRPDIYKKHLRKKDINVLEASEFNDLRYETKVDVMALKKYYRKAKRWNPIYYMCRGTKRHALMYFRSEARAKKRIKALIKAKKRVYYKPQRYPINMLKELVSKAPEAISYINKMVYTNQVFNGPTGVTNMYVSKYPLVSRSTKFNAKSLDNRILKTKRHKGKFNRHQGKNYVSWTNVSFKLFEEHLTWFKSTLKTYASIRL